MLQRKSEQIQIQKYLEKATHSSEKRTTVPSCLIPDKFNMA